MKIHRSRPESHFTVIPNDTLRDDRLSYAARGVLAEILSRPDDWKTTADAIWKRARLERGKRGESRNVVRTAFTELEVAGYLYRGRHRGGRGRIATELDVFDTAQQLQEDGSPVYFALAAQLTGARPSGRRSDQGEARIAAGRTNDQDTGVGVSGVGVSGVGGPVVYKKNDDEDLSTKNFEEEKDDDENPGVLTSPVQVEGNGHGEVKTGFDVIAADFGRPHGLTDEQWEDIAWLGPAVELARQHQAKSS